MSGAWYAFLLEGRPADFRRAAEAMCRPAGMMRVDCIVAMRRCHGLVNFPLDEGRARAAAEALGAAGYPAVALSDDRIVRTGRACVTHNADCLPEGFRVQTDALGSASVVPWDALWLLSVVRCRPLPVETPGAAPEGERTFMSRADMDDLASTSWIPDRRPPPKEREPEILCEVFAERAALRVRILEDAFNYDYLGPRMGANARLNFLELLVDLRRFAPGMSVSPFTLRYQGGDRLLHDIVEDGPPSRQPKGIRPLEF